MTAWQFLVVGYAATVAVETPVLLLGLSPQHSRQTRLFAGFWLTACTYPVVVLTLPWVVPQAYDLAAETFAPLAEVLLFGWITGQWNWRDTAAITAANLISYGVGLLLFG